MWNLVRPLLALLLLLSAGSARAIEVSYSGTDLPDEPEAGDRWRDEYWLDGFPYDAGRGFSVFFDPTLYAGHEVALPGPGVAWYPIALEPDPGLGAFGVYDAEVLVDAAPATAVFRVRFEVRDPSFDVVESGTTIVLEPGAIAALFRLRAPRRSRC